MSSKTLLILVIVVSMGMIQAQQTRFMTGLEIYPQNVTMEAGDQLRFTAVSRSHSGMMHTPQILNWQATGGTINQRGKYVAGQRGGRYTVTVSYGGRQTRATVNIKTLSSNIARIAVFPGNAQMGVGATRRFTATAYDNYNRPVAFTPRWQATGGFIDASGNFRATNNGTFTITARDPQSQKFGRATVSVGWGPTPTPAIARVQIFPRNVRISAGQTYNFSATAYNSYGQVVQNARIRWSAQGGTIGKNGRFTAGYNPGRYQVTAKARRSTASDTVWVTISGNSPVPPPSNARIVVTHWDVGGGNMFKPKAKANVKVFGRNIQTVKLFAVGSYGGMTELQAFSVSNGSAVYFNTKYDRFYASWLELRLYDNRGQVVAKDRRAAE